MNSIHKDQSKSRVRSGTNHAALILHPWQIEDDYLAHNLHLFLWTLIAQVLILPFYFHFRYSAFKAVVIAFFCTFFQALNVPVFWPILVMYFIILFTITMKRQIKVRSFLNFRASHFLSDEESCFIF